METGSDDVGVIFQLTVHSCVTGVLGCPRSCLHAILSLLQRGTEKRSGPVLTQQAPHLAELCYQVLFVLSTLFSSKLNVYMEFVCELIFVFLVCVSPSLSPSLR